MAASTALQIGRRLKRVITQLRLLIIVQHRCVWKLPEHLMPSADVLLCLQLSSSLLILENSPSSHFRPSPGTRRW